MHDGWGRMQVGAESSSIEETLKYDMRKCIYTAGRIIS
jgi:hypothetical protein